MFLLFSFVAFGAGLIWQGLNAVTGATLLFGVIALVTRTVVLWLSLLPLELDAQSRRLIVWFGPRGLSSLLLILLPVFAGIGGAEALFPLCALVVLMSVVLHGAMLPVLIKRLSRSGPGPGTAPKQAPASSPARPAGRPVKPLPIAGATVGREKISLEQLQQLWDRGEPVRILDVRTDRSYREDDLTARGAIRLHPDRATTAAAELALPREDWLVAYCTGKDEATSARVARELQQAGWSRARALIGGWNAWQAAGMPVQQREEGDGQRRRPERSEGEE
jgi:rhodanese-related sulfurtransferase